ncbi:MAG: sugar-binding protein [Mucilaginibacter sp.]|nr:sugar-binding protein [Mucilaginibacter sp.]
MFIITNYIKSRLKVSIAAFMLLLSALSLKAQLVGPTMTGTPAPGAYYNYSSITLTNFSFTASAGNSLQLYIANPDCQLLNSAASSNQNYIKTSTPRSPAFVPGVNYATCDLMQTIQYFDGLGRPLQSVYVKGSPLGMDVVQPVAYDQFGREVTKHLPYAATTNDGSYKTDALTGAQSAFYHPVGSTGTQQSTGVVNTQYPSATTVFEPSPLNRVTEQGAPGLSWQPGGHTVKAGYGTNAANDIILWAVNSAGNGLTGGNAFYTAGTLYTTTTTDENGNSTIEYKDTEGHVVCKKVPDPANAGSYLATYYVYNDLNNLSYVIPPPQVTTAPYPPSILETDALFTSFIYGYHYDARNRLMEKKIPGKGWEFMVYNRIDQVIFTQDAVQRSQSPQVWTYIKYDAQGRVAITGLWSSGTLTGSAGDSNIASPGHVLEQWLITWAINNQPVLWVSKDNTQPTGYSTIDPQGPVLTTNYYDDYRNIPGLPTDFVVIGNSAMTKGLLTATKIAVLNTIYNTTPDMLCAVHYYDDFGRNIKTYQQHYLGGVLSAYNYDIVTNVYDFTNEVTATIRQHFIKNAGNTAAVPGVTVANTYSYDHMGRKNQTFEKINTGSNILLSQADYNEIGQVKAKHLHGATGAAPFLQDISYKYNERSWLKRINDPAMAPTATRLFSQQLGYDSVKTTTVLPNYNGNITEQLFQVYGSVMYPGQQNVVYAYDPLNRLKSGNSSTTISESGIAYDNLGNITSLKRGSNTAYGYVYNGNQLTSVSGITASNYGYDANGNANHDGRNNADLTYNLLNLPQTVLSTAPATIINIIYTYDATGQKLRKVSTAGGVTTNTDYISGIQYTNGAIAFIQTEEGRVNNNAGTYTYEYTLTDHLGNNRVTFDQTNGKVGEEEYYPFGMNVERQANATNKYLYNGKELQDGLGQYDYGARFYDPVIVRWNTVDPKSEKSRRFSIYAYGSDNPIRFKDPDGMFSTDVTKNKDGTYTVVNAKADGDKNVYLVKNANSKHDANSKVIARSVTDHSFLEDNGKAAVGAKIDLSDKSGANFLNNKIIGNKSLSILDYIHNAHGYQKYDFKTNGPNGETDGIKDVPLDQQEAYKYRGGVVDGVPGLSSNSDVPTVASARDIGNIGAGWMAGDWGISWNMFRDKADGLQRSQTGNPTEVEGQTTQKAERIGFDLGMKAWSKMIKGGR